MRIKFVFLTFGLLIATTTLVRSARAQTGQGSEPSGQKVIKDPVEYNAKPSGAQGSGAAAALALAQYTKEQVEETNRQNKRTQQTNTLIQQAQAAISAKDWKSAIPPLEQAIALNPQNWQLDSALGDAHLNLGQYETAAAAYEKGAEAAEAMDVADPRNPLSDPARRKAGLFHLYNGEGDAYLKLQVSDNRAVNAFAKAAALQPGAFAYFNLCAAAYTSGNGDAALDACDKAIAADPNKADAYFIKGSMLVASSKTDSTGRIIAPPGTAEALNKYLELAPAGPHASDVNQMLQFIGSRIQTAKRPVPKPPQ